MANGVSATGGGHCAHTKRQRHLLGKIIQQRVEAFEATFVDGHFDSPKKAVSALVEGDAFGRGAAHMGRAPLVGRGKGRGILFRWGVRVPHPGPDRLHCVGLSYSHVWKTWSKSMSKSDLNAP